ncbi:MAG: sulfatase-like hydrolase/transferase [Isosphaeraceae bacterium]
MHARRWLAVGLLLFALPLARPSAGPIRLLRRPTPERSPISAERQGRAPHILLILSDDQAAGLMGIDGDPRQATPNLDGLARQGVRFDRAYCNAPVCTASRQSLFTGRMPHAVGATQLLTPMPRSAVTLSDWLAALGYRTAAFGKLHFNTTDPHGFEVVEDTPEWYRHDRPRRQARQTRRGEWRPFRDPPAIWLNARCLPTEIPAEDEESAYYADRAIEFLAQGDEGRPAFVVASFHEPHAPFVFPSDWPNRYDPRDFEVPESTEAERRARPRVFDRLTEEDFRGIQAAYYSSLSWMDRCIGRLLDRLDDLGLADDTIVLFVSDNGYLLGEHGRFEKNCFYEQAVRVPMIVRWPGKLPADRRVTEMAELVDIVPTLLDLAGLPKPPHLHGRSLAPLLKGHPDARGRRVVVSEYPENEEAMARSARFKLIVGSGARRRRDGLDNGLPLPGPYEHLYDLEDDPRENHDLAGDPAYRSIADELRTELARRLRETREGQEPVPSWLDEGAAIRWSLVPRDRDRFAGLFDLLESRSRTGQDGGRVAR